MANSDMENIITLDRLGDFLVKTDERYIHSDNPPDFGLSINGHTVTIVKDGTNKSVTVPDDNTTYTPASSSPKMDGTAAVGTSAKYAREDHVHPTDTSRADASALTSHVNDTTVHITAAERDAWNAKANAVTQVSTGAGLTGGPITSTGTVKANLVSETKLATAATTRTEVSDRVYPVSLDSNGKLAAMVPWENTTYTPASATPSMDGTGAVGSSTKYAREDHVHPTDTSRAAASALTSHTGDTTVHITAAERTAWNANKPGTVTKVSTGTGLTGGDVTTTGTIKANLVSDTKLSTAATTRSEVTNRVYPVSVDSNGKLAAMVPWENTTYNTMTESEADTGTATTGRLITAAELKNQIFSRIANATWAELEAYMS